MEILRSENEFRKEPIDAMIHKVWYAIPGMNGIEVDVQASYEAMKSSGSFDEEKLVLKQIPPEISLKDLPPSPIYRGNEEKPLVAFMINVAWGNEYIPKILKILDEHQVRATFFLDGSWVKNNPNLAKMIVEEGHEIGNHAYSHPDMKTLTRNRIYEELVKTNEVIQDTTKQTPIWFAPPSGSFRQEVVDVAREIGMYTVLWTVDTIDWKNPHPDVMTEHVINNVGPGSLVLMHPTSATVQGLETMIKGVQNKGFRLGTVSETLSETRVILKH